MEVMKEKDILLSEWEYTGTSWTHNDSFEENGFLIIKNLYDYKKLLCPPPEKTGMYKWCGNILDQFTYNEDESQVEGSIARYWHPHYRQAHRDIRLILEKEIGRKLYATYY